MITERSPVMMKKEALLLEAIRRLFSFDFGL